MRRAPRFAECSSYQSGTMGKLQVGWSDHSGRSNTANTEIRPKSRRSLKRKRKIEQDQPTVQSLLPSEIHQKESLWTDLSSNFENMQTAALPIGKYCFLWNFPLWFQNWKIGQNHYFVGVEAIGLHGWWIPLSISGFSSWKWSQSTNLGQFPLSSSEIWSRLALPLKWSPLKWSLTLQATTKSAARQLQTIGS